MAPCTPRPAALLLLFLTLVIAQDGGPYCIKVGEDVCTTTPREECNDETRQECETFEEEVCVPATDESCSRVPSAQDKCVTIEREVCRDVDRKVCQPKEKKMCEDVKKWVCPQHHGHFVCKCVWKFGRRLSFCADDCERKWSKKWCWIEWEKSCKAVMMEECTMVTEKKCEKVPEEACVPATEIACETIPTEKCRTDSVEKCEPVTENICKTVEDQECEKQQVDRFCTNDIEGLLRSLIFNGDVLGAASVLSSSEDVFSLGEGLAYLPEQNFLVFQSDNRTRDPDVVAFQAIATSALNDTDVTKLVNAIIISVIPDCRCRDRTAAEYDVIARGLKEDLSDRNYLQQLVDDDLSDFEGRGRRRLAGTNVSPVNSFICAFCAPIRSCQKFWWC